MARRQFGAGQTLLGTIRRIGMNYLAHAIEKNKEIYRFEGRRGVRLLVSCLLGLTLLASPAFGQHLHQLEYNNSDWADTDLTAASGGPTVYNIGVTAFTTSSNGQIHVYYVASANSDENYDVHQLYYDGSTWTDEDLTVATGGANAYNGTGMSGFAIGNAQYVYFCDSSFNVHQFAYGDGGNWNWVDTNLNAATGKGFSASCADYSISMAAVVTPNQHRHVYYQGDYQSHGRNSIREMVWNGSGWSSQDLTVETKGATGYGTFMSATTIHNNCYLFFQTNTTGHIHMYAFDSLADSWSDTDLTVASGGVPADAFEPNGPAAFRIPNTERFEVYYSTGSDVHQMTFKNKAWSDEDLGGPAPYSLGQILAFPTTPNDQFHVYYNGQGGNAVDQMYFNGSSWSYGTLPSVGVGFAAGMAGFAVDNYQYVYYISAD
jgi:hypothetical protein